MKVEFSFDKAAVERQGYAQEDVNCTIKRLFAVYDLPCVSEGATLAFKDKGHGDDFACMWEIIMALLRSDWFLACVATCVWQDDDGAPENILVKAGKVRDAV